MMICAAGPYWINMAAIIAVVFHKTTLDVSKEPTEHCVVYLQGVPEIPLDSQGTAELKQAFATLMENLQRQQVIGAYGSLPGPSQKRH